MVAYDCSLLNDGRRRGARRPRNTEVAAILPAEVNPEPSEMFEVTRCSEAASDDRVETEISGQRSGGIDGFCAVTCEEHRRGFSIHDGVCQTVPPIVLTAFTTCASGTALATRAVRDRSDAAFGYSLAVSSTGFATRASCSSAATSAVPPAGSTRTTTSPGPSLHAVSSPSYVAFRFRCNLMGLTFHRL